MNNNQETSKLFSPNIREQYQSQPADKYQDHLLEQYKSYVDSAQKNSDRRNTANTFFLTINTALITILGYLQIKETTNFQIASHLLIALAGIAISIMWYLLIRSYKDLNTAKFKVIHQIEKQLPISPYDAEWDEVGRGDDSRRYLPFTHIELRIPFVFLFLHFMAFVFAVSASSSSVSLEKPTYRIGLGPWVGFGPLYLAKEKGYFDEAGINVDLVVLTGLAERNSALKSGKVAALAAPVDYFVLSAGNNLETSIVMAIDESVGGDGIVAKQDIKTIEDLKGKKVAFQRGLPGEFFLRSLLKDHNVSINDMETMDMETAQAGAAFLTGNVDAAVVWEPWLTKAKEEGGGHILVSTKEYRDLIVDVLAFNKDVVSQHPQDVQKIVDAVQKAIDYWRHNTEEANRIMAPYFQLDATKYATILSGASFTDIMRNRQYFGTDQERGPIFDVALKASKVWEEAKVIETPVEPKSIISRQFIARGKK
jgi:NitT/TauT family transport system substrate-binding protein